MNRRSLLISPLAALFCRKADAESLSKKLPGEIKPMEPLLIATPRDSGEAIYRLLQQYREGKPLERR